MKILVIQGHPDPQSYIAACARTYVEAARAVGHEVHILDLALAEFDPVLRYGYRQRMDADTFIDTSQDEVMWAEHIVVCFPVWWAAEPSVLKGWWERVLVPHLAYEYIPGKTKPRQLLAGKTATLIVTAHAPSWFVRVMPGYPVQRIKRAVLGYCGVSLKRTFILGGMDSVADTPARRTAFLEDVRALGEAT